MRLLGYWHDPQECFRIRKLLEDSGIPVYREISGFNTNRAALFVCINSQFSDAVALLSNPHHVVAQPVDAAQFRLASQTEGRGTILKWSLAILGILLLVVALLVFFDLGAKS